MKRRKKKLFWGVGSGLDNNSDGFGDRYWFCFLNDGHRHASEEGARKHVQKLRQGTDLRRKSSKRGKA